MNDAERLAQLKEIQKQKQLLAQLKAERDHRKRHWSIRYYAVKADGSVKGPHKGQSSFHRSKSLIRVASGGNRSGKSTCGGNEAVAHSLGYRPWLKPEDPDYKVNVRVPNKGLICGESFGEQVKKVLIPKLLGDPENGVPGAIPTSELLYTKKNPQGVITEIGLKNGSNIHLQSYDQPVELFESSDHDWFWADEPPPRAIWVAVQRGLADRRGRSWITMTPLKEPWIFDEIYPRPDVELFYFDIEDNLGYGLTREGIDQFARSLTPDEMEARLRGKYFHLTGLVYKSYQKIHRVKRAEVWKSTNGKIPRHWALWFHVDTHPRTPHHAVWIAVAPDQRKYICGELKNGDPNNKIKPFAEALKIYERTFFNRGIDEVVRLMEPGAQSPNPGEGLSIWDEFAKYGFRCKPGSKNRDAGILLFQDALQFDPERGLYPTIFVFDDLPGVHKELTHYIWDDWAMKAGQGKTEKQVPKDKDDHLIEGIHRILLDEPYCDSAGEDEEPEAVGQSTFNKITGY
jgi:hypothetical protein